MMSSDTWRMDGRGAERHDAQLEMVMVGGAGRHDAQMDMCGTGVKV